MPKHIAFLRAINVGGHVVKMEALRRLFEGLAFTQVETFIASGNVIFDSSSEDIPALQQTIERALQAALGYEVATFLRSPLSLQKIVSYRPFPNLDTTNGALYVAFVANPPSHEAVNKLSTYTNEIDQFQVKGCEIYWGCQKKMSESKFSGAVLERVLGMPATIRSISTIQKLAAKYA
ncbi:MAG: DUF1697 domain-containing protein [Anaerolinea sp.]|mgnify:CR=1 FL=1|nr:DUF1697 domain-containing protein [Anaerolinea sp.]CAG1013256.1 hypothetical protein ANRL4_04887 [Anaerolineae bacterium]